MLRIEVEKFNYVPMLQSPCRLMYHACSGTGRPSLFKVIDTALYSTPPPHMGVAMAFCFHFSFYSMGRGQTTYGLDPEQQSRDMANKLREH
jgi:hypothetical protein